MDQRNEPPEQPSTVSFNDPSQAEPLAPPTQSPGIQTRSMSSVWQNTLQNRTAVLATLFLVTGALGLPLLWYSPVFSRFEKLLWTLMTLMYTSALIGVTWAIIYWCYQLITGTLTAS